MAHSTLPVSLHPVFQQFFDGLLVHEGRRVERLLALCSYESPESTHGVCDGGFSCPELATVSDLQTGGEFCFSHFREVRVG